MSQSEEDYLNVSEDQIEISKGSLFIAKDLQTDIKMQDYLNQIDIMVNDLKTELRDIKAPSEIVKTINNYIFIKQSVRYQEDKDFLNYVLTNKAGSCNGISSLYLSITEKLKLPFYAVRTPEHLFIRYDDNTVKINIETTDGGESASDNWYIKTMNIPLISIEQGIYLCNLTKKQFFASLINNRGIVYCMKEEYKRAIYDFGKAISLNPKHAELYINRGNAYNEIREYQNAILDFNKAISMNPNSIIAYSGLGVSYGNIGDFNSALVNLSKVISLKPDNLLLLNTYINRAIIYVAKKDKINVYNNLKEAIKINPDAKADIKNHKAFKDYRNEEEFKRILE